MLAYDMARCHPQLPDSFCRNCKRYDLQEGQTYGERTPIVFWQNSTDNRCMYIPMENTDD